MMLRYIASYFLLCGLVIAWSCNSGKTQSESKDSINSVNDELIPVGDGFDWIYNIEGKTDDIASVRIDKVLETNDGRDVKFISFPVFNMPKEPSSMFIRKDGSVSIKRDDDFQLIIPAEKDLKKDYSWTSKEWTGYIQSVNETITAGGKEYQNIIKINYALGYTYSVELWIAKGTGIVKWGSYRTNPPAMNIQYYVLKEFKKK